MQVYWILFYEQPQMLQGLYDLQKRRYDVKLDVPRETPIITFRRFKPVNTIEREEIDWNKFIRETPECQKRVV